MSDLSLLNSYLGVEVLQNRNYICLKYEAYALRILEKFGLVECNLVQIPMEVQLSFKKDEVLLEKYNLFESLRYLTQT